MRWRNFQRGIWGVLAVCAGGVLLSCALSGMGLVLVVGQIDDGTVAWTLILIAFLALLVWGDGAIVAFTKGWERVAALVFVLAVEALALLTLLFFLFYFCTGPKYIPVYGPTGEVVLTAKEESWLFKVWGAFYLPAGPCLLRPTGVTYEAHDCWPFASGRYELELEDNQIIIHYDTGTGSWEICTVPLN